MRQSIQHGDFERIVLTGMDASFFASYPIWLLLINVGLPAPWMDCAELIHHARPIITKRTLVWITSQSGHSAEVVAALAIIKKVGATILATVNDLTSPLAQAAHYRVPIHAKVEKTVSTRTYVNTLTVSQLAALALTSDTIQKGLDDLNATADGMTDYFSDWEIHLQAMKACITPTPDLILLGRGPSLAAERAIKRQGDQKQWVAVPKLGNS